jgi:hypothetical protein
MKVTFHESVAGPNFSYRPDKTYEVPDADGCRFCEKGIGEPGDAAAQKTYDAYVAAKIKAPAAPAKAAPANPQTPPAK